MAPMVDDSELLAAWRAGDQAAGSELFDRHFESVRRFFASKLGTGVDDLVQQTFLACVGARERIREELGFRPYLFAVARSKLYDHLRETRREEGIDPDTVSVTDLGLRPSVVAAARQEEQIVKEALRRLPLDLQVALELYYFEGLRGPGLARVLDIPEGTVRSRLRRGLDILRERIDELVRSPELRKQTASTLASWAEEINAEWAGKRTPEGGT
jgi:RNA polymerase sigma-70 factor (ECF subfamily)